MNAEDFIVSFKRDMAALSRTERLRAIESVRDVLRGALFDDAAGVRELFNVEPPYMDYWDAAA